MRLVRLFGLQATAGDLGCVEISEVLHHEHSPALQIVTLLVKAGNVNMANTRNLEVMYLTN